MKIATSFLAGVIFMGALGGIGRAKAEDSVLAKDELTTGSYCHEKFPAIQPSTLGTENPTLKSTNTGDVIDFYGPCDENPTGNSQVQDQKIDQEHYLEQDYMD